MDQQELARALADLTGPLEPGPGATGADLQDARSDLARALLSGQRVEAIRSGAAQLPVALQQAAVQRLPGERLSEIARLSAGALKEVAARPAGSPITLAFLRTSPIRTGLDPSTPEWARGMEITRTRGPFIGPGGQSVWIDSFETVRLVPFVRAPQFPGSRESLLGLFPIVVGQPGSPRRFNLGKGSVWIVARLLAGGSPDGGFAGFRIKGGVIELDSNAVITPQAVRIPHGAVCRLTVDLDPPPDPPPTTGPGVDAAAAHAALPATVTIEFAPGGVQVTALADFGATIYRTTVHCKKRAAAPTYQDKMREILISGDAIPSQFTVVRSDSTMFFPAKSAAISGSAWALPVAVTTPDRLGQAAGAGAVVLELAGGIEARWTGLSAAVHFQTTILQLAPGQLSVLGHAKGAPFTQVFTLWNERAAEGSRRSAVEFQYSKAFDLTYFSLIAGQAGIEGLAVEGAAAAHLDRPRRADGTRFTLQAKSASLVIIENSAGQLAVALSGPLAPPAGQPPLLPIALENALLKVHQPQSLFLSGGLQDGAVPAGTIALGFALRSILPTLPDPYAASFVTRGAGGGDTDIGLLGATVRWQTPDAPQVSLSLTLAQAGARPAAGIVAPPANIAFVRGFGVALLDVSSNADQLGVVFRPREGAPVGVAVDALALSTAGMNVLVFTLPEISWEPMKAAPPPPPPVGIDTPPNDGGPSTLALPEVQQLVQLAPRPMLELFIKSVHQGEAAIAEFTLPFGLRARADLSGLLKNRGQLALNRPTFGGPLVGGLQVTMRPPHFERDDARFQGTAQTVDPYGTQVLGLTPAGIFNGEFGPSGPPERRGVPVRRYDLSGYGASVFSDWRDPNLQTVGVIKVQFDVFVGRTAYEVVQVQSYIYPYAIRVVRTITIGRQSAGSALRYDTGWQPASDGLFQFPGPSDFLGRVHTGAVQGVVRVRNIREQGGKLPPIRSLDWQPVTFDADVLLNPDIHILDGASGAGIVASRDVTGYLLVGPFNAIPQTAQLKALLDQHAAGGPVACTVGIAASGTKLKAASVDISAAPDPDPTKAVIVAALRGSPVLPSDGAWTVGKRNTIGTQPPVALDPRFPVPLIKNNNDPVWHYAEPIDILSLGAPSSEYGLLQSTGTQKIFMARPQMSPNAASFHSPQPPHLADVGALFNATSIFPDLGAALGFEDAPNADLKVVGDGLQIHREFDITDGTPAKGLRRPNTLVDFKAVKVELAYHDGDKPAPRRAHAVVDIAPGSWQIKITHLSFPVVTPFGDENDPLLRIRGDAVATSTSAPTLTNLRIVYGGVLAPIESIFANLQRLAAFLPGGAGAGLDVSFSSGKLTIRDVFALPRLPLGVGFITDVALDLGMTMQLSPQSLEFTAGIGSQRKPFHWLVSPLSGTGVVQIGVRDGDLEFLVQAGIGAGLAIDLGIASGSASIVIAFQAETVGTHVTFMGLLTGQAAVDVLDGLASASLTLTAGLGITPDPLPPRLPPSTKPLDHVTLTAAVGVGIHISICWVCHVDFDDYWQFSQTLDVPDITSVLPI